MKSPEVTIISRTFVGEVHGQGGSRGRGVHPRRDYRGGVHNHRVELVVPACACAWNGGMVEWWCLLDQWKGIHVRDAHIKPRARAPVRAHTSMKYMNMHAPKRAHSVSLHLFHLGFFFSFSHTDTDTRLCTRLLELE